MVYTFQWVSDAGATSMIATNLKVGTKYRCFGQFKRFTTTFAKGYTNKTEYKYVTLGK